MTADELLALIETYTDDPNAEPKLWGRIEVEVERLHAAVLAEREACALLAHSFTRPHPVFDSRGVRPPVQEDIATAIRKRTP